MATFVVKRNGEREPFDGEKVRKGIELSSLEAGLSPEEAAQIADQVSASVIAWASDKEEVRALDIQEMVLGELDKEHPVVSNSWREFRRKKSGGSS